MVFYRFGLDFGGDLGAMLATFSFNMRIGCGVLPSFLLGLCSFSFVGRTGPLLAPFGLDLGGRGSILQVFGAHFLYTFQVLGIHFFNNLSPMLEAFSSLESGAGWAGGVTRRAKNLHAHTCLPLITAPTSHRHIG